MKRYEISNCEWERIKDKLPAQRTGKRGRPAKNNRIMLNECCGLQERELNGEKCQNAMDHGRVSMQDSENGRKMVYGKNFSYAFQ